MNMKGISNIGLGMSLLSGPFCGEAQQIACGQTMNCTITTAGQTNTYTFDANSGESATILALGQSLNAAADVYSPAGSHLGSCTNNFTGPIILPNSGAYTIRVHADNPLATGAYGLSLTFLTGRCGAPLIWGPSASNTVTALAEVDSYTFSGNAGEIVSINAIGTNLITAAFVASPAGTIIGNWVNGAASIGLTNSGIFTVGIYSFYIGGTGGYTASFAVTKLVPASFRLSIDPTNNAEVLTIWGQVGRPTVLQYTPVLPASEWLTLTNFVLPSSLYRFVDWSAANSPQRFYETVQ